ncbi:putative TYR1-prephenate dehydrogenase [Violaceomyces palustris]|uniref:TYR1-prephenate dehydrogenase n=1 Tax=Violaceomyces palustris TaxID=1673888 RepID=A0ACD0P1I5_9BASI|nr:putative TYR1-prephenate dehydrogenase [Violaceomyces palustris]
MTTQDEKEVIEVGIIGMGDMGKLYAHTLQRAGWKVNVCDRPENYKSLSQELKGSGLNVLKDGHQVSRQSDYIIYSVEAAFIDSVVAQYGPSTKVGAIVAGQTSVKAPEKEAFEKYLADDVHILSCHSMHGPTIDPTDQPLILIQHRAPDEKLRLVERIMSCFKSRYVYLTYDEHDRVTANTQAVTHAAFLSMGTAWKCSNQYPWDSGLYRGGIEMVKINICLRIYSNKWHVYAGLALLNPSAKIQVTQYAQSSTDLFKLMVAEKEEELIKRVFEARKGIFGWEDEEEGEGGGQRRSSNRDASEVIITRRKPILMSDKLLDRFNFAARKAAQLQAANGHGGGAGGEEDHDGEGRREEEKPQPPNSHLSLLAIVDCWHILGIDPYAHLDLAATPIFRVWIGVCEYLFRSPVRLRESIRAALYDHDFRSDDTEFIVAARGWAQAVQFGNFELYQQRFEETSTFFEPRFEEANIVGSEMLKVVAVPSP